MPIPTEPITIRNSRLDVGGATVEVASLHRRGTKPTLVCVHGFGSTKEDYADLCLHPAFADRDLVFLDVPGFGASTVADHTQLSIPFLVEMLDRVTQLLGLREFHLSGHSMGGLTALMFCAAHPSRVLSFIDIEGNVAPEDCFLSRQILQHPAATPDEFFDGFIERVASRPEYASRLYATALRAKVRPESVEPIFRSMVDLSDNHPLMDTLASLALPRVFIHGEQNAHLSYLPDLPSIGVEVVEIPYAGHFPMYSNPLALWTAMATFIHAVETRRPSASSSS